MAIKNYPDFYKKLTIAIILIGIILRFALASIYSISGDSCWQLSASRFLAENKEFPLFEPLGRDEPFWAPPLFHIMAAFLYSAFGIYSSTAAEFGMKMLSPLFGSLTLVLVYLINKKLFSEKITFYSMLFTAFIPIFIDYHVFSYIDGILAFFVVLSIYLALGGKYIKSSIAAGLAALAKYNGIFVLPILAYIAYKNTKNKKLLAKRLAVIFLVPLLIASPWLVRNYANFGNPFWPFFGFAFKDADAGAFGSAEFGGFDFKRIFDINSITFTYLAVFGVPDGNYKNIFFFDVPYMKLLLPAWIISTLFFILPFAKSLGIKEKSKRNFLLAWILSYAAVLLLYIGNVSWAATRFFLPAIPALGMLYGVGMCNINLKNKKLKILFHIIIFSIIIGFVFSESVKIVLASKEWGRYRDDFAWVRENTKKSDLILPGSQCLAYHLNRGTLNPTIENLKKADYVWVNQNFRLDRGAILDETFLNKIESGNYKLVYSNKATGTGIYQIKEKA